MSGEYAPGTTHWDGDEEPAPDEPSPDDEEDQPPRRPPVIGANWRRRTLRTYHYIHEMRENYYRPMADYLERRAGEYHSSARQPPPRSFAERSCSYQRRPRPLPRALAQRRSPPPFYQADTFSDGLLRAIGVSVPQYGKFDMTEDPVISGQLQPHKFSNHVPSTSDKILQALGVRPRSFSELPDVVEPTLTHVASEPEPELVRLMDQ